MERRQKLQHLKVQLRHELLSGPHNHCLHPLPYPLPVQYHEIGCRPQPAHIDTISHTFAIVLLYGNSFQAGTLCLSKICCLPELQLDTSTGLYNSLAYFRARRVSFNSMQAYGNRESGIWGGLTCTQSPSNQAYWPSVLWEVLSVMLII